MNFVFRGRKIMNLENLLNVLSIVWLSHGRMMNHTLISLGKEVILMADPRKFKITENQTSLLWVVQKNFMVHRTLKSLFFFLIPKRLILLAKVMFIKLIFQFRPFAILKIIGKRLALNTKIVYWFMGSRKFSLKC